MLRAAGLAGKVRILDRAIDSTRSAIIYEAAQEPQDDYQLHYLYARIDRLMNCRTIINDLYDWENKSGGKTWLFETEIIADRFIHGVSEARASTVIWKAMVDALKNLGRALMEVGRKLFAAFRTLFRAARTPTEPTKSPPPPLPFNARALAVESPCAPTSGWVRAEIRWARRFL